MTTYRSDVVFNLGETVYCKVMNPKVHSYDHLARGRRGKRMPSIKGKVVGMRFCSESYHYGTMLYKVLLNRPITTKSEMEIWEVERTRFDLTPFRTSTKNSSTNI